MCLADCVVSSKYHAAHWAEQNLLQSLNTMLWKVNRASSNDDHGAVLDDFQTCCLSLYLQKTASEKHHLLHWSSTHQAAFVQD